MQPSFLDIISGVDGVPADFELQLQFCYSQLQTFSIWYSSQLNHSAVSLV